MSRALVLSLLMVAPLLAGCLGGVEPAGVPQQALQENGWRQTREQADSLVLGLGSLHIREYEGDRFAGATVASLNDLPFVDEQEQLVPIALERVEQRRGVTFEPLGERSIELAELGRTVTGTEYRVRGAGGPAKAVIFSPGCEDFVVVVAYGLTEAAAESILGDTVNLYAKARDVTSNVRCSL